MKTEQPQTPNAEKDSKYWDAFALWWTPRNGGGQPDRNDAATWENYQYYCAGVMDERSPDVPNGLHERPGATTQKDTNAN